MPHDAHIAQAQRLVEQARLHLCSLLLDAIVARDGSACAYCHAPTVPGDSGPRGRTLDHIVPVSRGGNDEIENVCCVCRSCNARKGVRPQYQYVVRR
jgi:5-methylcytosine-specific restriction endonuclease McrA